MKSIWKHISVLLFCLVLIYQAQGQSYKRIISLAPSLTMNLYYLKSEHNLAGCTSYCEIAKPDKKEIVASAVKINLEKIVSLNPDLVLASSITNPESLDMLRKFGIRVEVFPSPKNFNEICTQFTALAGLVNKRPLADSILTRVKEKADGLRKAFTWTTTPKCFIQIGANPLFAVIPNTFMADYIHYMGADNMAYGLKKGSISRESVIARNPDIIIVVTMGVIGEEEMRIWKSYPEMSAARNKKIYIIDSNMACTPTPVSFVKTLETLFQLMNYPHTQRNGEKLTDMLLGKQ